VPPVPQLTEHAGEEQNVEAIAAQSVAGHITSGRVLEFGSPHMSASTRNSFSGSANEKSSMLSSMSPQAPSPAAKATVTNNLLI
jgi:hypothetical protein